MDESEVPQPLSQCKASGNYIFATNALLDNPELATLVSCTVAGWANTEARLGNLFAELIGTRQPATLIMYSALKTFEVQRALLEAVASERLSTKDNLLLKATLVVVARHAQTRHRFAHWIWGRSTDPHLSRTSILLAEPKHFWHLHARRIKTFKRKGSPTAFIRILMQSPPGVDPKHILVYRKPDLERAYRDMEVAFRLASVLSDMVGSKGAARRRLYNLLKTEPEIQIQMSKLHQAGKSTPDNSPKRRRK